MKENISRFKIDYSVCKNSPGGSILEKSPISKKNSNYTKRTRYTSTSNPQWFPVAVGKSRLLIEKLMK